MRIAIRSEAEKRAARMVLDPWVTVPKQLSERHRLLVLWQKLAIAATTFTIQSRSFPMEKSLDKNGWRVMQETLAGPLVESVSVLVGRMAERLLVPPSELPFVPVSAQ